MRSLRKKLLKNLFFTWILSTLLSAVIFWIWYNSQPMGFEEGQAMLIAMLLCAVFQNLVTALLTFAAVFVLNNENKNLAGVKFSYLFAPAVFTMILLYAFFFTGFGKEIALIIVPALSFGLTGFLFWKNESCSGIGSTSVRRNGS